MLRGMTGEAASDRSAAVGSSRARRCPIAPGALAALLVAVLGLACDPDAAAPPAPAARARPHGDLVGVALPAAGHAVVVAASGAIHWSVDAGASWHDARVPAVSGLAGVSMANGDVGWAVGPEVILRTEDGGRLWRKQRLPRRGASLRLVGIAALDGERALALGEGGLLLRTRDGGARWALAPASAPAAAGLAAVACSAAAGDACLLVGRSIYRTRDHGETLDPVLRADALDLPPVVLRFGRAELPTRVVREIEQALLAHPRLDALEWTIDVRVSGGEIEGIAGDRDASALFALIEARAEEARGMLEAAGVAAERIRVGAPPPWDYEELVDDDPGLLARYWRGRRALRPGIRIEAREAVALRAVALDESGRAVAVGRAGRVIARAPGATGFGRVDRAATHDLLAVALAAEGRIATVGGQGTALRAGPGGDWSPAVVDGPGALFDRLRAIDFDPSGRLGLAVGDDGRILCSRDAGRRWKVPDSSGSASIPIIR